jgi:Cu(I)/Ag(I) efflux system membrane protein CusA/SilA
MPTTMPHASIGEALDVVQKRTRPSAPFLKWNRWSARSGRADTAIDPAPIKHDRDGHRLQTEYITDANGKMLLFRHGQENRPLIRESGELIPEPQGQALPPVWCGHNRTPDDILARDCGCRTHAGRDRRTQAAAAHRRAAFVMLQKRHARAHWRKVKGPYLEASSAPAFEYRALF